LPVQTHTIIPGFWQYLGAFTGYTLFAIGLIYASFFYLRRNPALLAMLSKNPTAFFMSFAKSSSKNSGQAKVAPLAIETALPIEARKTLYIIRSGNERFLIATSAEGTQFLSKLAEESPAEQADEVSEAISIGLGAEGIAGAKATGVTNTSSSISMRAALENSFLRYLSKTVPYVSRRTGECKPR